jgi:hypothetical protein
LTTDPAKSFDGARRDLERERESTTTKVSNNQFGTMSFEPVHNYLNWLLRPVRHLLLIPCVILCTIANKNTVKQILPRCHKGSPAKEGYSHPVPKNNSIYSM